MRANMCKANRVSISIFNTKTLSLVSGVLLIAFLLFGSSAWGTRHALNGGHRFSKPVRRFFITVSELPSKAKGLRNLLSKWQGVQGEENIYKNYFASRNSTERLYGQILIPRLNSFGLSQVVLVDLETSDETVLMDGSEVKEVAQYTDYIENSDAFRQLEMSSSWVKYNPILTSDNLLVYLHEFNDLIAFDLNTRKERWRIRGAFHHSIEIDENGDIWTCASVESGSKYSSDGYGKDNYVDFEDQVLVRVSKSGKIVNVISVTDLLHKAGLEFLLYGVSNPNRISDLIHLNQVAPIFFDCGALKRGSLLVSLRNLSTIMNIDPNSKAVCWYKTGPWMNQHCAFQFNNSEISILDNHSFASGKYWVKEAWRTKGLLHNIETGETRKIQLGAIIDDTLRIPTQGRLQYTPFGAWMIEDCSHGTVIIVKDGVIIYKWSNMYPDGTVGITSWSRYIGADPRKTRKTM